MLDIKQLSKLVLTECKRERPGDFVNVTSKDIEQVLNIIFFNITHIIKERSMLAIKDRLIFRPNLRSLAQKKRLIKHYSGKNANQ